MRPLLDYLIANRGPIARIMLRAIGWLMIGFGWGTEESAGRIVTDSDLIVFVGTLIVGIAEFSYGVAKRKGWTT